MGVYSGWDSVKMKACITIVQFQLKYGRTLPPGKTRYPLYRRLGGPRGWSGREGNLAPPGFDPRTFQPVAQSLYRLSYPAHTTICTHFSAYKKKRACKFTRTT